MMRLLSTRYVRSFTVFCCCGVAAMCCVFGQAQTGEQPERQGANSVLAEAPGVIATSGEADAPASSPVSKRQAGAADKAYLAGVKKLGQDDLYGAQHEFERARLLNPANGNYAIAMSVVRERRINELVQHAGKARLAGDDRTAETLLAEARLIDPASPIVIEHSGAFVRQSINAQQGPDTAVVDVQRADRGPVLSDFRGGENWRIEAPVSAGPVRLLPSSSVQSFDLRGTSSDVVRDVAKAYGIRALIDDSLESRTLRFNLQHASYQQAIGAVMNMAHAFAVPIDQSTIMIAMDDTENRQRLERQLEETIYLPALSAEQINDLTQVVRTIFDITAKESSIEAGLGKILLRVPEYKLGPLNQTFKELLEGSGEVMVEVKLYEVTKTHSISAGATIPNQFTLFNVDQAANTIVNENQTLVQQGIAQGYIKLGTSNLDIALALIQLGLVQSPLATNLIGVFGGGLLKTGVSGSAATTVNVGLNSSDTRTLDYVQLRVGDGQDAIFRAGEKYPITQSSYSTGGVSNLPPGVANAKINGVSVASLVAQYGGTGTTIPLVTYEDLGLTLKAKPVIEKSGRINLLLDLKIEALSGNTLGPNPILNNRQFATDLTVADGESALMVSDVNRNESDAITGLPGLAALPGFQLPLDDTRDRNTSQLIVVVTPHVVRRRSNMIAGPRIPIQGSPADDEK